MLETKHAKYNFQFEVKILSLKCICPIFHHAFKIRIRYLMSKSIPFLASIFLLWSYKDFFEILEKNGHAKFEFTRFDHNYKKHAEVPLYRK